MIYDELYEVMKKKARHTLWVFSDLQQSKFENASKCMNICMEDYAMLGQPAEMMIYLGDSVESANLPELHRMCDMQVEHFDRLKIPLCYATGNHDYDYACACYREGRVSEPPVMPFYEAVQQHPGWHTTSSCEETFFSVDLDETWKLWFFCDHIARDFSWLSTHNHVRWGNELYPYGDSYWQDLSHRIGTDGKRAITCAHCAFPGGNRDIQLLGKMQPLPLNVRLHLYGHSHLGEYTWPREGVYSQIQWIDWQDIPQVDVASFENIRGSYCHSVIMHLYEDNSIGLFFRNHDAHCFTSAFFPAAETTEPADGFEHKAKTDEFWSTRKSWLEESPQHRIV